MNRNQLENIDDVIDGALSSEAMRDVPLGFHRRFDERLQLAALLDTERRRLRRALQASLTAAGMILVTGVSVWVVRDLPETLFREAPGARGHLDLIALQLGAYWLQIAAATTGICALAGGLLLSLERGGRRLLVGERKSR